MAEKKLRIANQRKVRALLSILSLADPESRSLIMMPMLDN